MVSLHDDGLVTLWDHFAVQEYFCARHCGALRLVVVVTPVFVGRSRPKFQMRSVAKGCRFGVRGGGLPELGTRGAFERADDVRGDPSAVVVAWLW